MTPGEALAQALAWDGHKRDPLDADIQHAVANERMALHQGDYSLADYWRMKVAQLQSMKRRHEFNAGYNAAWMA